MFHMNLLCVHISLPSLCKNYNILEEIIFEQDNWEYQGSTILNYTYFVVKLLVTD